MAYNMHFKVVANGSRTNECDNDIWLQSPKATLILQPESSHMFIEFSYI